MPASRDRLAYTSSKFTVCRPIAFIVARKNVAANVPRDACYIIPRIRPRCVPSLVGETDLAHASRRRLLEERPVLRIAPRAAGTESCQRVDLRIEIERLRERRFRLIEVSFEPHRCGEPKMGNPWPRVGGTRFDQQVDRLIDLIQQQSAPTQN